MALRGSRPGRHRFAEGRWPEHRSREKQEASLAQSNGNGSVRVEIYDQTYQLRGSDPEYIGKLADYVDTKMRVVAQQASTVDSLRVAVLAALNIADEYLEK